MPRLRRLLTILTAGAAAIAAGCGTPPEEPTWLAPTAPVSGSPSEFSPTQATTSASAPAVKYVFPVAGRTSFAHTHHDYPATDIMAPCGARVRATTSGQILELARKDTWTRKVNDGANRGGLSVSLLGDDGVRYYGSHFSAIDSKITPGARVTAGQTLGKVGDTGDASACHLHYGISPPCQGTGDWWTRRGAVWPWRYLESWRDGKQKSPVQAISGWLADHDCPAKPPTAA